MDQYRGLLFRDSLMRSQLNFKKIGLEVGALPLICQMLGFCPGVRVHKGISIVFFSLFRSHWLAVVYCLARCGGPCEPVHEDRTDARGISRGLCDFYTLVLSR